MALRIVANKGGRQGPGRPIGEAMAWAAAWRSFWESRFDRLSEYLERQKHEHRSKEEESDGRSKPSNDP